MPKVKNVIRKVAEAFIIAEICLLVLTSLFINEITLLEIGDTA